jgi:hypothetical protein
MEGHLWDRWEQLTPDAQCSLIAALVDHITVHPARTRHWDPDRIADPGPYPPHGTATSPGRWPTHPRVRAQVPTRSATRLRQPRSDNSGALRALAHLIVQVGDGASCQHV